MSPISSTIILAGNKCDLEEKRQVTTEEASEYALNNNLYFLETSAKSGYNIQELFLMGVDEILDKIEKGLYSDEVKFLSNFFYSDFRNKNRNL
jgi:GTPase SAR1 family protein